MNCGSCTLCCKLMEIKATESPVGKWCKFCDPKKGCRIYTNRPDECRKFLCAYAQMENVDEKFRPDHCKMIFEKISDRAFFGIMDKHPDKITRDASDQIKNFLKQGFSVILRKVGEDELSIKLAYQHTREDILKDFDNYRMSHGSSVIHN